MSYLANYKYDVFLSYAHIDNATTGIINDSIPKGWVHRFYDELKLYLDKRIGRLGSVGIWWDSRLTGNERFNNEIADTIGQSALFVAITSQGYLASDYCKKELTTFGIKASSGSIGLAVNNKLRIYNVLINNIDKTKWLPEYQGTTGYKVYRQLNPLTDKLGFPAEPETEIFQNCVKEVGNDIYDTLVMIRNQSVSPHLSDSQAQRPKPRVFFSKVADTLVSQKKQIIKELEANDIEVINVGFPPPYTKSEHAEKVKEKLNQAALSVHLFDSMPGIFIDGEGSVTFSQEQVEIARQEAKDQLIFIPKQLDFEEIEDATHKDFLLHLQNDKHEDDKYSLIRESAPSTIASEINQMLKKHRSTGNGSQTNTGHAVFLDFHEKDNVYAINVSNWLANAGVRTFFCMHGANPAESLKIFESKLKAVNAIIIIGGNVASEWVNERLIKAIELILKENYEISYLAVYIAPQVPFKYIPIKQNFLHIEMLDDSQNLQFNAKSFESFLEKIA